MKTAISTNNKAVVSSKGQIVIPRALREELGIHAGHELVFVVRHHNLNEKIIEITPLNRSIDMFFGRCKKNNEEAMSIQDMDDAIMKAVSENEE